MSNYPNRGRWGVCLHCGGTKPCSGCTAKNKQKWAEGNRERSRAQKTAYNQRYPERVRASKEANYKSKGAEYVKRAADRRKGNPEDRRVAERQSYARNSKPYLVRLQKRAERDKSVGGMFTNTDKCVMFGRQGGMCGNPYCEADLSITGFHVDHIHPVALGGSHDPINRQLLCPTCNHRKGALTNEAFLSKQKELAETA